jgi:hypothetical protein
MVERNLTPVNADIGLVEKGTGLRIGVFGAGHRVLINEIVDLDVLLIDYFFDFLKYKPLYEEWRKGLVDEDDPCPYAEGDEYELDIDEVRKIKATWTFVGVLTEKMTFFDLLSGRQERGEKFSSAHEFAEWGIANNLFDFWAESES